MSPERRSRFDGTPFSVGSPLADDMFTPGERVRRANGDASLQGELENSTDAMGEVTQGAYVDAAAAEGWGVKWVLAEQHGRVVVRSVTVEPVGSATPSGGITASLLRELSPALAAQLFVDNQDSVNEVEADLIRQTREWISTTIEPAPTETRRPGRPALQDSLLADLSLAYLQELQAGRGVLGRLAVQFNRPESTIRDWVRAARQRKFLTEAPKQGARGASAGPRLLELLNRDEGTSHE